MSTNASYMLGLIRSRLAGERFDVIGLKIGDIVRSPEEDEVAGPASGEKSWLEVMLDGSVYKIKANKVNMTWEQQNSWLEEYNKNPKQGSVF